MAASTNSMPSDPPIHLIVPDSHDWTKLGTGGGIETFLKTFLENARKMKLHVTVLCSGPREETVGSIHYRPVMPHADSELAFARRLRREVTHGRMGFAADAVILANAEHYAWAVQGLKLPIVLMSHGELDRTLRMRHSALYVFLFRYLIQRPAVLGAHRLIVVSSSLREYYVRRFPKLPQKQVFVVPIGIDVGELEHRPRSNPLQNLNLAAGEPVVLFVGRLYPEKNPSLFVAACDRLRADGVGFEAVVIGDGVQASELQHEISSRPWLHWIPTLTHSEVLDAMALSRVFALCSLYEAGPLVLLEALGLGTPIVATSVGRVRELMRHESGVIVDADPASCAAGIRTLLDRAPGPDRTYLTEIRSRVDFKLTMNALLEIIRAVRATQQLRGGINRMERDSPG